jgi:hypothetical protein
MMRNQLACMTLMMALWLAAPSTARAQAPAPAQGQGQDIDPAFRADIVKTMELTGTSKIGRQMATMISQQMLQNLKTQHPELPARNFQIVQEVAEKEFENAFEGPDGLQSKMIPLYAKYFTAEDIKGLIAFYQGPLGQKSLSVMPALMQDAMKIGQQWAAEATPRVQEAIKKRIDAEGTVKQ